MACNEQVPESSPVHQAARFLVDYMNGAFAGFTPLAAIDQPWLVDLVAPGKGPLKMRVRDAERMARRLRTNEWLALGRPHDADLRHVSNPGCPRCP